MEKSLKKCTPKLVPDAFLILEINPKQSLHARNSSRNKTLRKKIIKKLQKVNFNFSFEPSLF